MKTRREQDARHREVVRAYYETGDEALLNPMLAELRPRLVDFFKVKGPRDAELIADLTQDALAQALKSLHRKLYTGTGSMASWLNEIGWRCYIAHLKRKTNLITRPGMNEDPFLLLALTDDEDAAVEPAEAARAGALVMGATDAVLDLDADARAAVALHYYQGLPVKEAAQQLGISANMVRVRLRRGLAQLQSWANTQPRPTADTYAAVRHLDTGPLFQEPALRLAS